MIEITLNTPASDAALSVPAADLAPNQKPSARIFGARRYDGAASDNRVMEGWNTGLDKPEPLGAEYERSTLVARLRDLERNDPLGRAAIERRIDNIIGTGWRLTAKPNTKALGIDFELGVDLAEAMECEWDLYLDDPLQRFTVEEDYTPTDLFATAYRSYYRDGEVLALVTFDDDLGDARYGTRLQLIDPDRISNPDNGMDTPTLTRGIEHTPAGKPLAVHLREAHPADWTATAKRYTWRRIPFRDPYGRPLVIHHKDRTRIGQMRGVSRLTPIIKGLRAINVFDDAELQSKVVNALFTGYIKSAMTWPP